MKQVEVDVWSDFVCPWCWIAKTRLARAIDSLKDEMQVTVRYRAYRIGRGAAAGDFQRAVQEKFGSAAQAAQMMQAVAQQGELEGLVYRFDTMRFGDTADAHALVQAMGDERDRNTLVEALMRASITDGRNIFDRAELRQIALAAGMPAEAVAACRFETAGVQEDEQLAAQMGSGVPLFLLNGQLYFSGAQPFEVFQQALRRAAETAPESAAVQSGGTCGPDGCSV